MVVAVTYSAPGTKQFRIVSQTGSKMLADHVLKKLFEAEQESAADPRQTAPTTANYRFTLEGQQLLDGRPCYHAPCRSPDQFPPPLSGYHLGRCGRFCDRQNRSYPARNPSFWIRDTKIHHINAKTGEFWLPERNESDTDVRFGGRATLTIDYGAYTMDAPAPRPQQAELQPAPAPLPSGK